MPRARGHPKKTSRAKSRRSVQRDYSSSSDHNDSVSDGKNEIGMISNILTWFMQSNSGKKRRAPKRRRRADNNCQNQCQCWHCTKKSSRRRTASKTKRGKATEAVTSTQPTVELESEPEATTSSVVQVHSGNIKNKVDSFFKLLESDEEQEDESKKGKTAAEISPKKTKEFYMLSTDSEDETDEVQVGNIVSTPKPSTSGSQIVGLKTLSSTTNLNSEKKTEDLFAYVDEILNECNEVVDLTDSKIKGSVPVLSLEDLKKKTDEILGGVASFIEDLIPMPKEPQKKPQESTAREVPTCPICFEELGGARQAMTTLCGHMFCETCLQSVVATTKKCPSCRKRLTKTKYHPVYI